MVSDRVVPLYLHAVEMGYGQVNKLCPQISGETK